MLGRRFTSKTRLVILLICLFSIYNLWLGNYSTVSQERKERVWQTLKVSGSRDTNGPLTNKNSSTYDEPRMKLNPKRAPQNVIYNKPIKKRIVSNLTTIFSEDYIPREYSSIIIDKSTIHFCQIVAKTEYALEVEMFVKSVILHARRSGVFFHFIAAEGAEKSLPKIFDTITHAFVEVRYEIIHVPNLTGYLNDKFDNKVKFIHPWSGIYGTGKIFMYDLMRHVDSCIVIDSDTLFGVDPVFLWNEAKQQLKLPVVLAATWSPTPEHFNSGVMVHDLARMRELQFSRFISTNCCQEIRFNGKTTFRCQHDQQLLLQMLNDHRELFYLLSVSWNLDKCSSYKELTFDSFRDHEPVRDVHVDNVNVRDDHMSVLDDNVTVRDVHNVIVRDAHITDFFFGVVHFCCSPKQLRHVYERGTQYINNTGLVNYFNYLKDLDFTHIGEKEVHSVTIKT